MSFESKTMLGESAGAKRKLPVLFQNILQLVGMFLLGAGLVFAALKTYALVISGQSLSDYFPDTPVRITTEQRQEKQAESIVNGLIVGVGGKGHRGSYNTDTMIVVSFNPSTKQLNMISLPRDLYVNIDKGYYGRINGILDYYMFTKDLGLTGGMQKLSEKVGMMLGQQIHYYGMIDFQGFEKIIDTLGGLRVDVPEELYDPAFPVDNFNYGILHIDAGEQVMDGNTALNYARSRHSTSDFDRSRRQQIIIRALLDKLLSFGGVSKIKPLYDDFKETIVTNVGFADVVSYLPYVSKIGHMNTIVFQSDCPANLNQIRPGCVLYSPGRDAFGGAAVLLPLGATPTNISNYTKLFQFVNRIIYYPFGDFNEYNLGVYNSVDTALVKKPVAGIASQMGVELVRNGLYVDHAANNDIKLAKTSIIAVNTGIKNKEIAEYTSLVEDILDISDIQILSAHQLTGVYSGQELSGSYLASGVDIDIMLFIGSDALLGAAQ